MPPPRGTHTSADAYIVVPPGEARGGTASQPSPGRAGPLGVTADLPPTSTWTSVVDRVPWSRAVPSTDFSVLTAAIQPTDYHPIPPPRHAHRGGLRMTTGPVPRADDSGLAAVEQPQRFGERAPPLASAPSPIAAVGLDHTKATAGRGVRPILSAGVRYETMAVATPGDIVRTHTGRDPLPPQLLHTAHPLPVVAVPVVATGACPRMTTSRMAPSPSSSASLAAADDPRATVVPRAKGERAGGGGLRPGQSFLNPLASVPMEVSGHELPPGATPETPRRPRDAWTTRVAPAAYASSWAGLHHLQQASKVPSGRRVFST